jgi:hypothetical protein
MARRKQHYREGDWFAVPLEESGYALGLIARMKKSGIFGYFFSRRYAEVPTLVDAARLRSADAIERLIFGDLDLLNRAWPVLGALPAWDRQQWPMPSFVHRDVVSGCPYIRTRDQESLNLLSERRAREEETVGLPEDGSFGAGAVVIRISHLIRQQEQAAQPAES